MTPVPGARVLVAGIGNVFFGDDGFGPAVVERLHRQRRKDLPETVDVADYGIRGVHLAYELLDGRYGSLVLVDVLPLGEPPGTLAVLEVDDPGQFGGQVDAHSMSPAAVLAALSALGGSAPRVLVVGCQPADVDPGMALSGPVAVALEEAVRLVVETARAEAFRSEAARMDAVVPAATGGRGEVALSEVVVPAAVIAAGARCEPVVGGRGRAPAAAEVR